MSDGKFHQFRPPLYHVAQRPEAGRRERDGQGENAKASRNGPAQRRSTQGASEQKGWDAYRKWLSSVSGKAKSERVPVDASIYSWKGYQNWADRVRQSWKSEDS